MTDPTGELHESSTVSTRTRRRFLASAAGAAASLGLSGHLIPRVARAAIGLNDVAPRLLGYREIPIPLAVRKSATRLAALLKDEGYEVVPKAYEIDYTFAGSKRTITRLVGPASASDRAAAVVGTEREAAAYIETISGGSVDHFRLFLADRADPRETARLTLAEGRVTAIKAVQDAPHSTDELEWLGKLIAMRGTDKENCTCCMQCCYPGPSSDFLCDLGSTVACAAGGAVTEACKKNPYTVIACSVGCWLLFDVLCSEGKALSSCGSCSGLCSNVYGMKARCYPGETCGHAGCI